MRRFQLYLEVRMWPRRRPSTPTALSINAPQFPSLWARPQCCAASLMQNQRCWHWQVIETQQESNSSYLQHHPPAAGLTGTQMLPHCDCSHFGG